MDVEKVLGYQISQTEQAYTARDAILYALGVNLGRDPTSEDDLSYLYEDGLKVLPSYAMVLAHPGFWLRDPELQVDWVKVLHAEQFLSVARPLAGEGSVRANYAVTGIVDKGEGKGAILYFDKVLQDAQTGVEIARVTTGVFARGDGGCGNHGKVPEPLEPPPERAPDVKLTRQTDLRSALIYRLSGDYNPIHVSPQIAKKAGYERPILHGLCTMGIAGHGLIEAIAGGDADRLSGYACRFSRPVFPGDTLRLEAWTGASKIRFRVIAEERNEVVLDRGQATLVS